MARLQKLSLKARALKYLSAREHSRFELRAKLIRHAVNDAKAPSPPRQRFNSEENEPELPGDDDFAVENKASPQAEFHAKVDNLLDELEALKYLSNERFAESLAHRKNERFGVLKLSQELRAHKMPAELLNATLAEAKHTEMQRASQVWSRKFSSLPETVEERAKQQRFLATRGFSSQVVSKVLKGRCEEY